MDNQLFAFTCGRHRLSGDYRQQRIAYAKISQLRDELEQRGAFNSIRQHAAADATRAWLSSMDLVWETFCQRYRQLLPYNKRSEGP